jgi:hypothetical protein
MNNRNAAVIAMVSILIGPPAHAEDFTKVLSRFVSAGWMTEHHLYEKIASANCYITSVNAEGDKVGISFPSKQIDREIVVHVAESATPSKDAVVYKIRGGSVTIDGGASIPLLVFNYDSSVNPVEFGPGNSVPFYLPDVPDILDLMASGKAATFQLGGITVKFDLTGFEPALREHRKCVARFAQPKTLATKETSP